MNTTTQARRASFVLALVAVNLTLVAAPAVAGTDTPAPRSGPVAVDAWVSGATSTTSGEKAASAQVDAWAGGQVEPSFAVDPWAAGQVDPAPAPAPNTSVVRETPATSAIPVQLLLLGLLIAAGLGAVAAVVAGHDRTPSPR